MIIGTFMNIQDILTLERVFADAHFTSKKHALQEIAKKAQESLDLEISDRNIFDGLIQRERLGTTGIGNGVAIPHMKLKSLTHIAGFLYIIEPSIEFDAIDDKPVDIIFLLIAPEEANTDHLRALSCITRLLRETQLLQKLRAAESKEEVYALLIDPSINQDENAA